MKVIDLLNKIAKGETFENCKIKLKGIEPEEISEYFIYDSLYEDDITLNDEVEIIEEDKEYMEIEEIKIYELEDRTQLEFKQKINALIKNQKKIINDLKENKK